MGEAKAIGLIATDLDGTFLRDDKCISAEDLSTLDKLGEEGIVRVAATGRSLHKVKEVLEDKIPFDYVIFSSGAGIYDWREGKLLVSEAFEKEVSGELSKYLAELELNFVVFKPIPDNNKFLYHRGKKVNDEFENYLERHKGDFGELDTESYEERAGQFLSIMENDEEKFGSVKQKLEARFDGIRVIRTTSPIDKKFLWLEIFPENVSKGQGIKWLCEHLTINEKRTVGIGNDYNDIEMLDFVDCPIVLKNSPEELYQLYQLAEKSNNECGFSEAVRLVGLL